MREIRTIMMASDYEGHVADSYNCPGARAFKRAYKNNMPWYKKIFKRESFFAWISNHSGKGSLYKWKSFNEEGRPINMMLHTKVGDSVIFNNF